MSGEPKPPVLWSTVIIRWAVVVLLAVVVFIAVRPSVATWLAGSRRLSMSGDSADIRLVGVAPDGNDDLYDAQGRPITGERLNWPGERDVTWSAQQLKRDFLFELGPDAAGLESSANNPGSIIVDDRRGWLNSTSLRLGDERVTSADGRTRLLLRTQISDQYWRRNLFGGRQRPVELVDVTLNFYGPQRGQAQFTFKGPFQPGVTNKPQPVRPVSLVVLTNSSAETGYSVLFRAFASTYGWYDQQILIYDTEGRRHFAQQRSVSSGPLGWTNEFYVTGLPLNRVAAVALGEQPRQKTFHNIQVRYPDQPVRSYAPVLDRLAAALGKTNMAASSLEHYSPRDTREAMTVLEFRPMNRNALNTLAYGGRTTNFAELTDTQRYTLHRQARAMTEHADSGIRMMGLRIGLRGDWPEFLPLTFARLTNGLPDEQLDAAGALALQRKALGAEHVPALAAQARVDTPPALGAAIVGLLARVRVPAATNALLALADAEEPWLWWSAIRALGRRQFDPLEAQSEELQQRVVLVKDLTNANPALVTVARARLPGLFTTKMRERAPDAFREVHQRIAMRLDRATAMETFIGYLRREDPAHWRSDHPFELVRQVNGWYGKDFGGVGDEKKRSYTYPSTDAWPAIVEDMVEFYDGLKRDGKVETGP